MVDTYVQLPHACNVEAGKEARNGFGECMHWNSKRKNSFLAKRIITQEASEEHKGYPENSCMYYTIENESFYSVSALCEAGGSLVSH